MRINRTLNALAFLSMFSLAGPALSQTAPTSTEARMNATAESVYHDNMKNGAAASATALALLSGTRSASLTLAEQNAVTNQQLNNSIMSKMLSQNVVVGPTEGASAINKVNTSDLPALLAQLVAIATAGKQEERIVIQQVPAAQ